MRIRIEIRGKKAYIHTPYHRTFISKIKGIKGAKWSKQKRAWTVDVAYIPTVRQMMYEVFDECDIPAGGKRFDAKLTFRADVGCHLSDVYFFAKGVITVYTYDSRLRIRVSDDVCYLSGDCELRPSADGWWAVVKQGSVVMVYDVPETLVQREARCPYVDYEFTEHVPEAGPQLQPGA